MNRITESKPSKLHKKSIEAKVPATKADITPLFSVENPLPDDIQFIRQTKHIPSLWEIVPLFFIPSLIFIHIIGVYHEGLHLRAQLNMIFGYAILLGPWMVGRFRWRKLHDKTQRWGIFFLQNEMVIRKPVAVYRVPYDLIETQYLDKLGQVDQQRTLANGKTFVFSKFAYRPKGHLAQKKLRLLGGWEKNISEIVDFLKERTDALKLTALPNKKSESQKSKLAWEAALRRVYRYRRWLPRQLINTIPSMPCSMEEKKSFLDNLKANEHRIQYRDRFHLGLLSLFWVVNVGMAIISLVSYFINAKVHNFENIKSPEIAIILVWLALPAAFYISKLPKWWQRKEAPWIFVNLFFTVITLFFFAAVFSKIFGYN